MEQSTKLWNREYIFLLLISTFNAMGFCMTSAIIAGYSLTLGTSLTIAGMIAGIFSTAAMITRPLSGFLTDKVRNKTLLIISAAGCSLSLLGYAFSPNAFILGIFRFTHGLFYAMSGTTSSTMAVRVIPKNRLGEGISLFAFANVFASAIGPRISVPLVELGYHFPFLATVLMTGLGCLMAFFLKPDVQEKRDNATKQKLHINNFISIRAVPLAIVSGLFSFTNGIIGAFLVTMGVERGIEGISIYFTVKALILLGSRFIVSKLSDKVKLSFIYYPSMCFEIVALILIARSKAVVTIAVAAVFKALGQGMGQPAIQAEIMRKANPALLGIATSTFYIASDAGQGLGPVIGGMFSDKLGYGSAFYFGAIIMFAGAIFYNIYMRMNSEKG